MDVSAPSPNERGPGAGHGGLDLHELEVPEVARLAAGSSSSASGRSPRARPPPEAVQMSTRSCW